MATHLPTVMISLVCGFFAILFLQSALDKLVDWSGNVAYFNEHFANTPLQSMNKSLLGVLTVVELITGLACLLAIAMYAIGAVIVVPQIALSLCGLTLLMLFFGQRMAKDYVGAANLAVYFAVVLIGLAITATPR